MMTTSKQAPEREEIESLLPWHAAGTLSRSDAERVERALASDQELARRFDLVREELSETIHLNESLGAPSSRAMERLFAKIDAEPVRRVSTSPVSVSLSSRIADFINSLSPRTLAWSAGAAAFALLLQAGVIASVVVGEKGNYTVASAPVSVAAGPQALIRFAPGATAADINKLLESNKISLVSGPTAGGMYRLAVTGLSKEELIKVVKHLEENRAVVEFAAPAN
jgi:hypothetical protein